MMNHLQVRREVTTLLEQHRGVLKREHFDGGVICHLQKRPEAAAAAALREIGRRTDFSSANNKPAFLTHWLMKLAAADELGPAVPNGMPLVHCHCSQRTSVLPRTWNVQCSALVVVLIQRNHECEGTSSDSWITEAKTCGAERVLAPTQKSSLQKPDLRRLPRATASAIEKLVDSSPWIDWRHFDAGVMKVLQQLALSAEDNALAEIRQVEVSELSSVKNMPAYLNKCFNNRLWKVRY